MILYLLCCCGVDDKILLPYTLYTWSCMYVCMYDYGKLVLWFKRHTHDHNMMIMWKVYSHASVSKVKGAFSLKEPMRYYDDMLAWVPNECCYELK